MISDVIFHFYFRLAAVCHQRFSFCPGGKGVMSRSGSRDTMHYMLQEISATTPPMCHRHKTQETSTPPESQRLKSHGNVTKSRCHKRNTQETIIQSKCQRHALQSDRLLTPPGAVQTKVVMSRTNV